MRRNMEKGNKARNVSVIKDADGNNVVLINDIIYKGKWAINWDDVEKYLKEYVGDFYKIAETNDVIYFGKDLPDEYAHSDYKYRARKPLPMKSVVG